MEIIMKFRKFAGIFTAAVSAFAAASLSAMTAFAEDATEAASGSAASPSTGGAFMSLFLPLIIMFVLLYFLAIKPQKKREKELKMMQESLMVGDEVVTGGGIVGIVVRTGGDTVVIETGGERHKLRIKTWAISENVTAAERYKEAKAAKANASAPVESAKLVDDTAEDSKKKKKNSDEE